MTTPTNQDLYTVLGVSRDASEDDIRRAYKAAAKREHPDRNPGDPGAEARFKAASEAYATLSDPEKRSAYDRWGSGGPPPQGGGFDPFSGFGDMFSEIFGRARGPSRPTGPTKGRDVRVVARVPLRDAMSGTSVEVALDLPTVCEACNGRGGTGVSPCSDCSGSGQVMQRQGFMSVFHTCPRCGGRGERVEVSCNPCGGEGHVSKRKRLNVSVPRGISTGQQLRVSGGGLPGERGGPPGDAYVVIEVEDPAGWWREGDDLVTKVQVGMVEAALGCEVDVTLPDGEIVSVRVPPGTQTSSQVAVPGRGMPRLRGPEVRGDLRAIVDLRVPVRLEGRARDLLEALREELARQGS